MSPMHSTDLDTSPFVTLKAGIITRLITAMVAVLALFATSAQAEWREATTDHFIIVSGGSERQLVRTAQQLEAVHWLMTMASGTTETDRPVKVRIYLVDGVRSVRDAMSSERNPRVLGFYRPTVEGAIAVVPRSEGEISTTILFHEYAHHFMLQYLRGAYPPWYVEGFAEVISSTEFTDDDRIVFGAPADHRAYELTRQPWVPVPRMFAQRSADDARAGVANYGQYWLATHYFIFSGQRQGELRTFLNNVLAGQSHAEATSAFTGGLEQVDRDLRNYLRVGRFRAQSVGIPPERQRPPTLRLLRPGEAAIIDDELQAARPMTAEAHLPIAARVATIAARHPDDPAVALLHARLLHYARRYAEADQAIDRVLVLDPANVRALTLKGRLMLEARVADGGTADVALLRQARSYIARANRLDPDDQMPLIAYYDSFRFARVPAPQLALEGLYKASTLVPQEPGLRMTVAMEMLSRRNLPVARSLLAPLALSPHQSGGQSYALVLMQWIDSGAEGPLPVHVPIIEIDVSED